MQPKMSVEEIRSFLEMDFPQVHDGFSVDEVGPMRARVRLSPGHGELRPGGTVSGPTLFTLADLGVYVAALAMIGPKALTVTTNASIDFMRKPAPGLDLVAEVDLLKLGRVLIVGDVHMRSEGQEQVVARASLTYSIPPKD